MICADCQAEFEPSPDSPLPVTQTVTVGSITSATTGRAGPYCPACDDALCHLNALWYSTSYGGFGYCGCGNPGDVWTLFRDTLAMCPLYRQNDLDAMQEDGVSGFWYLLLYVLDRAGLTEHGTSVAGSWLTPKGKHYLTLMQAHDWDHVENAGLPHHGEACPADCPHKIGYENQ